MIADIRGWHSALDSMQQQELRLRRDGQWVSGPSDLLSIGEVASRELTHSAVFGWLLTPTGRHGLGTRLLEAILTAGWDEAIPDLAAATVQREVTRGARRADIVVTAGALTLVIENKVWAMESDAQCEDLFRLWAGEGQDARFLLLSPDGRPPRQVHTDEARNAWRTLSYRSLANWLEQNLPVSLTTTAHQSVGLYADSLRHTFGSGSGFAVGRPVLDDRPVRN